MRFFSFFFFLLFFCFYSPLCLGNFRVKEKSCPVYIDPSLSSLEICTITKETEFTINQKLETQQEKQEKLIRVETKTCIGFADPLCLKEIENKEQEKTTTTEEQILSDSEPKEKEIEVLSEKIASPLQQKQIEIGMNANYDGCFATTENNIELNSSINSQGSGWGMGVFASTYFFSSFLRFSILLQYQRLGLSRNLNLSGVLVDPSSSAFEQTRNFWGGTLQGGYRLDPYFFSSSSDFFRLYIETGFQTLFPLSSTQSGPNGVQDFSPEDRLFLWLMGFSADLSFSPDWRVSGTFQGYMNLGAKEKTLFYGIRFVLGISWAVI